MQPTIIAVQGKCDSGKTTTILIAFEELRKQGRSKQKSVSGRDSADEVRGDIIEIDGIDVGIISVGDKAANLKKLLRALLNAGCLVIVCATRSFGDTTTVVDQLADTCRIVRISKPRMAKAHRESSNRETADRIVSEVKFAIDRAKLGKA